MFDYIDEDAKNTFKEIKKYCRCIIEEIEDKFNDKPVNIMIIFKTIITIIFETIQILINLQDTEARKFYNNYPMIIVNTLLAHLNL